jgi:hypothetical protein
MPRTPAPTDKTDRRRMRDRMLEWQDENWDEMIGSLELGLDAVRKQWGFCPKCRSKVQVDFPDLRTRNDTVRMIAELSGSKPRADSDVSGGGLIVKRTIVAPEGVENVGIGESPEAA